MNSKKTFHNIFVRKNYPSYINEDYVYELFEKCLFELSPLIEQSFHESIPNPHLMLSYIYGEYNYIAEPLSDENREKLIHDEEFKARMVHTITQKIFFNEYSSYKAFPLIDRFNPVISTLRFYLNFVLDRIVYLNFKEEADSLLMDMLRKAFLSCYGVTSLLTEGFETEAFSTWRTIHETECIVKIIFENPYIIKTYKRHIEYNRAFRNEFKDKELQQATIDEIKVFLKKHDLKSKDLKKYIEYGWLYSLKDVKENYPGIKLNFRNGIEYVASLNDYSSIYEMSSEIAHSSPMLIYSNKPFFLKISLICLYETFFRMEEIFSKILKKQKKEDTQAYFAIRSSYLDELKLMLSREKFEFKLMNEKN